jgi:hypothetical protein
MSELPPNIDAILASIRSRMNDDVALPPPPPVSEPAPMAVTVPDLGAVVVSPNGVTIDTLVRSMVEPMLKAWLDANLSRIVADSVDAATSAEIRRLTGRD